MKALQLTLFLTLLLGFALQAQDFTGDWKLDIPQEDGTVASAKFSVKADGTYTLDFNMDGSLDVYGRYTLDGNQVAVVDYDGDYACPDGQKGVYTMRIENDVLQLTKVSEECPGRDSPSGYMEFTRL